MKKLVLTAIVASCAASVFAQGTINFNNRVGATTHVYAPNPLAPTEALHGNSSIDSPSGSTSYTGHALIGAGGTGGQYGATTTFAQLLAANGADQPEASLQP